MHVQFYFTLRDGLDDQLDGKNTVFGEVVDGFEVLEQISNAYVDDKGRPFIDIRCVLCFAEIGTSVTHPLLSPFVFASRSPASPTR